MKRLILFISMILIFSGSIFCDGPATVDLGTSGNYVILAKTGVSTTGTTSILGDIGISPASAGYITGFDLILDPSGTYSTSSLVTGNIYAADYTSPTPSILTTAISDMQTAYTDAAGRLDPDYTELYAGDLTGQTLVPGLYSWSSGVLISAGGLTIAGSTDDVWIFQIAQNVTVGDGAIITLSGGAQPENIFWQIAGQATIGTTAQFKGIILCQTLISLNTGASLTGRLLAQTAVTTDANSVVEPTSITQLIEGEIPLQASLISNYPNPFNPDTNISFFIPNEQMVILLIYDLMGREVKHLFSGQLAAGQHSVAWDGTDENHNPVVSGIYFYKLKAGETENTKKMLLIK